MILGAALFVAGFSVVFIIGALAVSAAGAALAAHQSLLTRIGGAIVIVLALVFLGVGAGMGSQREMRTHWRPAAGLAGAPLLGAAFAVGWSPCTGPTLGAIYSLAAPLAGDAPVARGALLAAAYSVGLGVPFVLAAAGWSRAARANDWLRRHQRGVQLAGGGLLLALGLLMVSGAWEGIMSWVQSHLIIGFETVL
jgi:cytochrome c-type biogenesis protein